MTSAADRLGPHLLGRRQPTPDPRDYRLEDFLAAYDRIAASGVALTPGTTLEQLAADHDLTAWHDIYAFWRWFKNEFLNGPTPTPPSPPSPTPPPPSVVGAVEWQAGPVSDQGQTGECVGFTGLDWGNCLPIDDVWPNAEGSAIYFKCVPSDVGKPTQQGSDSRTLCKVLQAMGRLGAYAFTTDAKVAAAYVQQHGPIGTGIPWDNDMFNPDKDGYVRPGGGEAGGHELMFNGYSPTGYGAVEEPSFKFPNHWSTSWGIKGFAYITLADWQTLLTGRAQKGDVWAGLESPLSPV